MVKKIIYGVLTLIVLGASFFYWLISSIVPEGGIKDHTQTEPADLMYLEHAVTEQRGKILAVVTSAETMGNTDKSTGYELTELSRAYYVFQANGFEVDVASPQGGEPPVVIDDGDMGPFDYAFLNDEVAQQKVINSVALADVVPAEYEAVYFVGGKGAMFDFPDNPDVQRIVRHLWQNDKTVAAICHGPAALVNVTLDDGSNLLEGKQVSSFTNDEELFLIPDAEEIFPFLLETKMRERGAHVQLGQTYLEQVSHDGNLITGQNPWSIWQTAEVIVKQLGYTPIERKVTATEYTVNVLNQYHKNGFAMAKQNLLNMVEQQKVKVDKEALAVHGIVAIVKFKLGQAIDIFRLLHHVRDY